MNHKPLFKHHSLLLTSTNHPSLSTLHPTPHLSRSTPHPLGPRGHRQRLTDHPQELGTVPIEHLLQIHGLAELGAWFSGWEQVVAGAMVRDG